MRGIRGILSVGLLAGLSAWPGVARAQGPALHPVGVIRPAMPARGASPRFDIYEMDRYSSIGAAIGTTIGLTYALVAEHGQYRPLGIIVDTTAGFAAGVVGGMAAYVGKLVIDR